MAKTLRFIDLFAGLGGFHHGLVSATNSTCVFASELDTGLRELYARNFGFKPAGDITRIAAETIPEHDVLCAGFPCQPFSLAGQKAGKSCGRDGQLIDEVIRITAYHMPAAIILENVPNILTIEQGSFWQYIAGSFARIGYHLQTRCFSPVEFGIPQNRNRLFIVGFRSKQKMKTYRWPEPKGSPPPHLDTFLDENSDARFLEEPKRKQLERWQELLTYLDTEELTAHTITAPEFGASYPEDFSALSLAEMKRYAGAYGADLSAHRSWASLLKDMPSYTRKTRSVPQWMRANVKHSRYLYGRHQSFLADWATRLDKTFNSWQSLEWRGQKNTTDLRHCLIQFRPSGIRIMKAHNAPSLIAMTPTQIPIIGRSMRYMSKHEAARLQCLDRLAYMPYDNTCAFKALGNAVNAGIVACVTRNIAKVLEDSS